MGSRDSGALRALALATQLGFTVACPLVVFVAGGAWADDKLGSRPWLLFLGLILGIGSAGAALYQIAAASPRRSATGKREAPEVRQPGDEEPKSED